VNYHSRGSLGVWIGRGFLLAAGFALYKVVRGVLLLFAMTMWDSAEHASPGVRRFVRGSLSAVAQPGSAPALGAPNSTPTAPSLASNC
jgi:hypothetical protein